MTTFSNQRQLLRFDEVNPETKPVAVLQLEPSEIEERGAPKFHEAYDDLDYLTFSLLLLPSQHRVALVRHKRSPEPGTEVCVAPDETNVLGRLMEMISFLDLSKENFLWIHSLYEKEVRDQFIVLEKQRSAVLERIRNQ
jgi:hypothetical protein